MKKPWLKKNPLMSMWLSGANTVLGTARGKATAQARREVSAFWSAALTPPTAKRKPRRRR